MKTHTIFRVYRDGNCGSRPKNFKLAGKVMNPLWAAFNSYAGKNGFTEPVEGDYLGYLAWKNPRTGVIMELRREGE